jgi:hypothetical protein
MVRRLCGVLYLRELLKKCEHEPIGGADGVVLGVVLLVRLQSGDLIKALLPGLLIDHGPFLDEVHLTPSLLCGLAGLVSSGDCTLLARVVVLPESILEDKVGGVGFRESEVSPILHVSHERGARDPMR